jgi:hypothetical protein
MFCTPLVLTLGLTLGGGAVPAQEPALQTQDPAPQAQAKPQDPDDQQAEAKEPPTPEHTGIRALFGNLGEDVKKLPSMQNLYLAGIGGGLAAVAHPVDQRFNAHLQSHYDSVNAAFAPGKYLGDTPRAGGAIARHVRLWPAIR